MRNSTNSSHPESWFVAYVRSCQEKRTADLLSGLGIEHYLPVQKERRRWSDRIKVIDKLVLPGMIFIRTTEVKRLALLSETSLIRCFMSKGGPFNPVIIPDRQIEDFRFAIENGEDKVSVTSEVFAPGDKIEIISGPLLGLRAEIANVSDQRYAVIHVGNICTAIIKISLKEIKIVEPLQNDK